MVVRLTEVEAYGGADDPASHAHRGRTPRTLPMFDTEGTLYVYRSYGIHWCMNVVVGPVGQGAAVLVRAGAIVAGLDTIRQRRGRSDHETDGPGKVCQALGVDGAMDGSSVLCSGPVQLSEESMDVGPIEAMPRVGITKAAEFAWRFVAVGTSDDQQMGRLRG